MSQKKLKRAVRGRRLSRSEVARDEDVRRRVQEEFPPVPGRTVPDALSSALKQAIEGSQKSVYQIAMEAGVSQIVVSRFLSGERDIRMATADKLAEALELRLVASRG